MRLPMTLLMSLFIVLPVFAEQLNGKVVRVADGDTIYVQQKGRTYAVRLNALDCPEVGHFASLSKKLVETLVLQKAVKVRTYGKDRYGRWIGDVFLENGKSLKQELIRSSYCRRASDYAPGKSKTE